VTDAPQPARWMRPLVTILVIVVSANAFADGRGRAVYAGALAVAALYALADRLLRRWLGDELAAKRALQIASATVLSVSSTLGLVDLWRAGSILTAWSPALAVTFAVELGVTAASMVTAVRPQLAMPLLQLHHGLLLISCDYVVRHRFGTAVMLIAIFQETTNVGWYLHWILNSPESRYHARFVTLFNVNALWTIAWYAVGRFVIVTPLLGYCLWITPAGAPFAYVALFVVGLLAMLLMNAQNLLKLARSYPRCESSWMHEPQSEKR
jgi:hypothetical protein